jgi:hypothetical protein
MGVRRRFVWASLTVRLGFVLGGWSFVLLDASAGSAICAVLVHGFYSVGTGIILNDMIGKATLYSNPVQHNILWIAYCGIAAIVCVATKGRLFYRGHFPVACSTASATAS